MKNLFSPSLWIYNIRFDLRKRKEKKNKKEKKEKKDKRKE